MDSTSQGRFSAWERFWFTPRDPSVLAVIRILCGVITLYTMVAYSFTLQDFFGVNAWYDLEARTRHYRERAAAIEPLTGRHVPLAVPVTKEEQDYVKSYWQKWGEKPPA